MREIGFNEVELNGFLFHSTVPPVPAGVYCLDSKTRDSNAMAIQHLHITDRVLARTIGETIKPLHCFTNTIEIPLFTIHSYNGK